MKNTLIIGCLLSIVHACTPQQEKTVTPQQKHVPNPYEFIGKQKAKAMVLGVFHFTNPGLDSYQEKFEVNALSEQKQKELAEVRDLLAQYKPTKILVEWNRIRHDSLLNTRYQLFRKDSFDISQKADETYQLGFKLAKRLQHDRIYCSDAKADWFGAKLDWDNYDADEYMKKLGQYDKAARYRYTPLYQLFDSLKAHQTLREHLALLNHPESCLKSHQHYLTMGILEGAGDNYVGADAVTKWYRRNIRIFSNAYDLTDFDREERLLLIYGSGHVWQLRQFFTDSPDYDYVEPNDYLLN